MAEYFPPSEDLPKFNEAVFDEPYSIEGLDRRVVHKAGTETITGNKTFTGITTLDSSGVNTIQSSFAGIANLMNASAGVNKFTANATDGANYLQATGTNGQNILFAKVNTLYGEEGNKIESNLPNSVISNVIGNQVKCVGGYNLITSESLSIDANVIQATGTIASNSMVTAGGNNQMIANGTGRNILLSQNSNNSIIAGASGANLMLVGTNEKLNMTSTTTTLTNVSNTITSTTTTGTNTLTSAKTSAGANLLNATGTGGGNSMTTASGQNLISSGGGGSNLIQCIGGSARNTIYTTGTASNANFIDTFDGTGGNTIRASSGNNTISTTTGTNYIQSSGGSTIMEVTGGNGNNIIRNTSTGTGGNQMIANASGNGFNQITGFNNYYDVTSTHYIRTGSTPANKIVVNPTSTTLTNNSHTITATGNNILNTSAGENFMNVTAGVGSNVLQVTSTAAGAGNKLLAGSSANGFNQISGYNNYYDVNVSGAQYIRVNGANKIVVNNTNVNVAAVNIDLTGDVYNYSPGGPSFNSIGTGSGGLYHTYYPDGFGAGRKAYVGYPGGGSTEFAIRNDYTNGSISLGVAGDGNGSGTINLNSTIMKKNNLVYPNIQIQWQTYDIPSGINSWFNMTNNYFSNGNFTVGEANYIKFPFDTRCNWIMISFEAASFNGFTSRELQIRFLSSGGTAYVVGTTGPILGNTDRAQYIQCNTTILPFNTELTPQFLYTGTNIGGTFYGKQFTANFNFTQQ